MAWGQIRRFWALVAVMPVKTVRLAPLLLLAVAAEEMSTLPAETGGRVVAAVVARALPAEPA